MDSVEFVDESVEPEQDAAERRAAPRRWALPAWRTELLALGGWAVAAVLLVLAPFRPLFRFTTVHPHALIR